MVSPAQSAGVGPAVLPCTGTRPAVGGRSGRGLMAFAEAITRFLRTARWGDIGSGELSSSSMVHRLVLALLSAACLSATCFLAFSSEGFRLRRRE